MLAQIIGQISGGGIGIIAANVDKLLQITNGVEHSSDLNEKFSDYLNEVQLGMITLHHQITENWFHFQQGDAA